MPASGVFPLVSGVDFSAAVYRVALFGEAGGAPGALRSGGARFFFASEVLLRAGAKPSYALAEIPLADFEESAPAVAGVPGGPLEGVRIGARAGVSVLSGGAAHALLAGSVVNIQQDLGADGATFTILDDRWLLEGVPVVGQFMYDPAGGTITYRQRGPCRFNPDGRPNCLDAPGGPLFAPAPGFGLGEGQAEPVPGQAAQAARSWRHSDIIAYLRRTLCSDELASQTVLFPAFARVDETKLIVPAALGEALLGDADANPDDARAEAGFQANDREGAGAAAKAPDLALEGLDLLSAFTRVVESAGAYALYCAPAEEREAARSVLSIVPTRYLDGAPAPVRVARPSGGTISDHASALGVVAGNLEEDGSELYTAVAVAGDPVALEIRLETSAGGGLQAAWEADDEQAFRDYIANHPAHPNSREAFLEAAWKYPRVFAAYQVDASFDYLAGTKYAGFPRATPHPPILPDLLTLLTETVNGTPRRTFPYPLSVEVKDDAGAFQARTKLDGLQVDDDGTLWLAGLRERGLSDPESGTWKGALSNPGALTARDLRLTLALEQDHRLVAGLGLSVEGSGTLPVADPNGEAAALAPGLRRMYWADAEGVYREQLRKGSWPEPQSVNGAQAFPDRASAGNELLSDAARAKAHAQRRLAELGRTRKSGRLVFPAPVLWTPGTAIEALVNSGASGSGSAFPIRGVVTRVRHSYRTNETEVELA